MDMKRLAIILALGAGLALPSAGLAGNGFAAKRGGDAQVHFIALARDGKIVGVKRFVFRGLEIACNEGSPLLTNKRRPLPRMRVRHHAFHGDFSNQAQTRRVQVDGVFRRHGRRAVGTLRARGAFTVDGTSYTGCDSGIAHWHVRRG
jgi:hypothetical protein